MASTEIRLYARISQIRTVPGVTEWKFTTVPSHKDRNDVAQARELSKADPDSVYAVHNKYTGRTHSAFHAGIEYGQYSEQTAVAQAQVAWAENHTGPETYAMWSLGHQRWMFHARTHSLAYLKAIGKQVYGDGPRSKTWYIEDADGKQVLGRLDGKLTKENLISIIDRRFIAEQERQSGMILPIDHYSHVWGQNPLKARTPITLAHRINIGARDIDAWLGEEKLLLSGQRREALRKMAEQMHETARILRMTDEEYIEAEIQAGTFGGAEDHE